MAKFESVEYFKEKLDEHCSILNSLSNRMKAGRFWKGSEDEAGWSIYERETGDMRQYMAAEVGMAVTALVNMLEPLAHAGEQYPADLELFKQGKARLLQVLDQTHINLAEGIPIAQRNLTLKSLPRPSVTVIDEITELIKTMGGWSAWVEKQATFDDMRGSFGFLSGIRSQVTSQTTRVKEAFVR